jgi:hypothetical protein
MAGLDLDTLFSAPREKETTPTGVICYFASENERKPNFKSTVSATLGCAGFALPILIFWGTCVCLSLQPIEEAASSFIRQTDADYKCLRISRKSTHAVVHVSMGTPFRELDLLLRMDNLYSNSTLPIRLLSDAARASSSLRCAPNGSSCYDVAQFRTRHSQNSPTIAVIGFTYINPASAVYWTSAAARLQLHGEFLISRDTEYYLEATRLCVSQARSRTDYTSQPHLAATALGTQVTSTRNDVTNVSLVKLRKGGKSCSLDSEPAVDLWPNAAASPSVYLSLGATPLSSIRGPIIEARRRIVEDGLTCAGETIANTPAYHSYLLDCMNLPCSPNGSIPFSHIADKAVLTVVPHGADAVHYWFEPSQVLKHIPGVGTDAQKVLFASCKLLLILLAAAVVWVRNTRDCSAESDSCEHTRGSKFEDAVLGVLAAAARIVTVLWRSPSLLAEDVPLVIGGELLSGTLSILHWVLRHSAAARNADTAASSIFGGSAAVLDSSAAVLIAFAEPPVNAPSDGRFDPTARLLTALLISTLGMDICSSSSSLCFKRSFSESLPSIRTCYFLSSAVWLVQSCCLAVSVSLMGIAPLAAGFTRSFSGSRRGATYATTCAYITLSVPRILKRV